MFAPQLGAGFGARAQNLERVDGDAIAADRRGHDALREVEQPRPGGRQKGLVFVLKVLGSNWSATHFDRPGWTAGLLA
jgi:hypothetical protein